jgi:hypothetical protein
MDGIFTALAGTATNVWEWNGYRFLTAIGVGGEWAMAGTLLPEVTARTGLGPVRRRSFSAPVRAFNPLLLQSPAMGALPTLRAATDSQVRGGKYFGPSGFLETRGYPKLVRSSARSQDRDFQRRL